MSRDIFEDEAKSRYDELFEEFLNLAINRFKWENLPSGLTSEQLEFLLISKGQLMYFVDETKGELILPCYATTDINNYGLATNYQVNSENGKYNETIDIDNGVILKNNPRASKDLRTLEIFAKRIDDVEMTQDVNLFQQCIPKLILADEDSKLTAKSLVDKIRKFKFVVFGKTSLMNNIKTSDVLDTSAPYILDKLQQHKADLKNELLTTLGINNNDNAKKKERQVVDEVNANNDYIKSMLDLMFDLREEFCTNVKEKFGSDIKVSKKEVEEDRTDNSNPGGTDRE